MGSTHREIQSRYNRVTFTTKPAFWLHFSTTPIQVIISF